MIKGENVSIRSISEKDLDEFISKLSDMNGLGEFLQMSFISEARFKKDYFEHGFLRDNAERYIISTVEDSIAGSIWMLKSVPYFDAYEIGYHIFDSKNRGRNYATEAVRLLTDYAFKAKQINRLEVRISVDNIASQRVALKAGFQHEGIARQAAFFQGKHHDMNVYALLRADWKRMK